MKIIQYQVDAFTQHVFGGNPAAVCALERWLDDSLLQAIAAENNLSETAFFVPADAEGVFELRWFTPLKEIDLCGHATLATAHIIFGVFDNPPSVITFQTRSGNLVVTRHEDELKMDFPARPPIHCSAPEQLIRALQRVPVEVLAADDYIAVFDDEPTVRELSPDPTLLAALDLRGVVITARGTDVDFVSRFFAPKFGINEDPVTGSAHCELAPYWARQLGRNRLSARQVSRRGGELTCEVNNDRVTIYGQAVTFMKAEIFVS